MAKSVSARSAKSKAASSSRRSRCGEMPSATTDADIARHARQDVTSPLSDRTWNGLSAEGRVRAVPPAEVPAEVDVRAIREKLKLSQPEFAARFGFTAASVRQWEQGRRRPHGPARVLLTIIAKEPNAVRRALEAVEG